MFIVFSYWSICIIIKCVCVCVCVVVVVTEFHACVCVVVVVTEFHACFYISYSVGIIFLNYLYDTEGFSTLII